MPLEKGRRQPLQMGEEVVPEVVLDVPRGSGENPAHEEAEYPAHHADADEQGPVPGQFPARDPEREVVDRLL